MIQTWIARLFGAKRTPLRFDAVFAKARRELGTIYRLDLLDAHVERPELRSQSLPTQKDN